MLGHWDALQAAKGETYVCPPDDNGTLDAINIGYDVSTCHHIFLRLWAEEHINPARIDRQIS